MVSSAVNGLGKPKDKLVKKKKKKPNKLATVTDHVPSNGKSNLVEVVKSELSALIKVPDEVEDSRLVGKKVFEQLVAPVEVGRFLETVLEKKVLLVKRAAGVGEENCWLSTSDIDRMLRENVLHFGVNVDVTSYEDGQRETHNQDGRAHAAVIWDFYKTGCSIRLLNPQTFVPRVWRKLALLQEFVGSFCGANVYLTPPGTQGFAPHWDDIEAFIVQLEGKKRWRVYAPRSPAETLPDYSSPNFREDEVGSPILDCVLTPGDLLYFPRGFIHQGNCLPEEHSLHITVSMHQKHAYSHLLEKLLPIAISKASLPGLKHSLPVDYLDWTGEGRPQKSAKREAMVSELQQLVKQLADVVPEVVDAACDQHALGSLRESLPPCLSEKEKSRSVVQSGSKWRGAEDGLSEEEYINEDTPVQLCRKNCVRLVAGAEGAYNLYYNTDNTLVYHQVELQSIEISEDDGTNVKALIVAYPEPITVAELPAGREDERLELVVGLFERGLLLVSSPLNET